MKHGCAREVWMFWSRLKCLRTDYRGLTGSPSAWSTRAKRQANQVQYNAKEVTRTFSTRLDGFGRDFRRGRDGVDDGGVGGGGDVEWWKRRCGRQTEVKKEK